MRSGSEVSATRRRSRSTFASMSLLSVAHKIAGWEPLLAPMARASRPRSYVVDVGTNGRRSICSNTSLQKFSNRVLLVSASRMGAAKLGSILNLCQTLNALGDYIAWRTAVHRTIA